MHNSSKKSPNRKGHQSPTSEFDDDDTDSDESPGVNSFYNKPLGIEKAFSVKL